MPHLLWFCDHWPPGAHSQPSQIWTHEFKLLFSSEVRARFLPSQASTPAKVDFMVKDKTAVTKFKSAMIPGSHPNEKEKNSHISVIHARFQDD